MYYQILVRVSKVDLVYTMRSCDFLTHFPVDIFLALLLQDWFANKLNLATGIFTYFVGSLHAYQKDMKLRGIF
jgi:thymidylate synthase